MPLIPEDILERIRDATDIADIVGEHVQLIKKGRNLFGLCPFHNENSPSFSVSPERQIYHCFGCGAHGNALRFLMEHDNLRFPEAVEQLHATVERMVERAYRPGSKRDRAAYEADFPQ